MQAAAPAPAQRPTPAHVDEPQPVPVHMGERRTIYRGGWVEWTVLALLIAVAAIMIWSALTIHA